MGDVVDADAGAGQRRVRRGGHGGGPPEVGVPGHVGRVLGVARTPQVHPPLVGHAERVGPRRAGQDHGGRHVDVHDRRHQLGVGVGDHAVVRRRGHDLARLPRHGEPGVRAGGGDLRHRRQHAAQRSAVLVEASAQVGPPGIVEEREGQVGLEDGVADLRGVEVHVHRKRPPLGRPERPRRLLSRLLQAADGGQRLRAGEQRQVEAARPDLGGGLPGQHLGDGPADARVAAPGRRRADALGQAAHGVVVLPGLRVDDVDALERAEERRRVRGARVGRGVVGHLLPHRQRLGRALGRLGGMPGAARDADDAGGAGVGGQRGGGGQPRDVPGMAMARSAMMFFWISVEPPPMVE